jgi:hypothetical protein
MEAVLMFKRLTALAVPLALGVALTACSGASSDPNGAGTAPRENGASPDANTAAIVACYRAHGDPSFPDPVYDPGDGRWHFATSPGGAPVSTQHACQHLFPVSNPSPPVPQAQFQKLVRLAECIRQHGVADWPDPNPQGEFPLPQALMQKSPAQEHAFQACQRYAPSGGINAVAAP